MVKKLATTWGVRLTLTFSPRFAVVLAAVCAAPVLPLSTSKFDRFIPSFSRLTPKFFSVVPLLLREKGLPRVFSEPPVLVSFSPPPVLRLLPRSPLSPHLIKMSRGFSVRGQFSSYCRFFSVFIGGFFRRASLTIYQSQTAPISFFFFPVRLGMLLFCLQFF